MTFMYVADKEIMVQLMNIKCFNMPKLMLRYYCLKYYVWIVEYHCVNNFNFKPKSQAKWVDKNALQSHI